MKKNISRKALMALVALSTSAYLSACSANSENNVSSENSIEGKSSTDVASAEEEGENTEETKGSSTQLGEQLIPETVGKERGFLVAGDENSENTMHFYFDPACPECFNYHYQNKDIERQHAENGITNISLVPIPFLDPYTADNYSSRAASAFITIAENEPDKAYDFFSALYDPEFFPYVGDSHEAKTTGELVDKALEVGVSEEVAEKIYENHYFEWVQQSVDFAEEDAVLFPEGRAETPTIVYNGSYDVSGKLIEDEDTEIVN